VGCLKTRVKLLGGAVRHSRGYPQDDDARRLSASQISALAGDSGRTKATPEYTSANKITRGKTVCQLFNSSKKNLDLLMSIQESSAFEKKAFLTDDLRPGDSTTGTPLAGVLFRNVPFIGLRPLLPLGMPGTICVPLCSPVLHVVKVREGPIASCRFTTWLLREINADQKKKPRVRLSSFHIAVHTLPHSPEGEVVVSLKG